MRPQKTFFAELAIRTITVLSLLFLWTSDQTAFAQLARGSFVGTIVDSTGAGVSQAAIQVSSMETGITVTTKSDATGHYEVAALQPGRYRLEATACPTVAASAAASR